jgi:hypothetical protein
MKKAKKAVKQASRARAKSKPVAKKKAIKVNAKRAQQPKAMKPKVKIKWRKKVKSNASGIVMQSAEQVQEQAPAFDFSSLPVPRLMAYQTPPPEIDGKGNVVRAYPAGPYCEIIVPCEFKERRVIGHRQVQDTPPEYAADGKKVLKEATYRLAQVIETVPVRKAHIWVRAIEGDERNGKGFVFLAHSESSVSEAFPIGMKVRWAGGTRLTLAKKCEVTDLPVVKPEPALLSAKIEMPPFMVKMNAQTGEQLALATA